MGGAKVIQVCQNDFLQENFYNLQNFFIQPVKSGNSTITELLHHTHLIWFHLNKIGLLHHKLFSKTFRPIVADPILVEHLENLITKFDRYLPNINLEAQLWVKNPFLSKVDNLSEDAAGLQEVLTDLHHDQFH